MLTQTKTQKLPCLHCSGTGTLTTYRVNADWHEVQVLKACRHCKGTGVVEYPLSYRDRAAGETGEDD